MSIVTWSDEYTVEIQEIDEQHKRLIDIINKLYEALAAQRDRDQVATVLNELVEYTKVHFEVEETLMRIFHYEEYDVHKEIHDRIVARVLDLQGKFHSGDDSVGMELLIFLKEWLFDHINKVDKRYTRHFHKHGAKKTWLRKFW
ncbi:bacteriohemerythrin [Thiohalomonas denitrificans]|uniref:bacteriohemerythrin n=1 Tax=Thiohalomonas denitrificans TaxID=415747 RepID=UPI0026EAB611|nr:bacteriohemerythrin [Thiohalomonas denitrificans]